MNTNGNEGNNRDGATAGRWFAMVVKDISRSIILLILVRLAQWVVGGGGILWIVAGFFLPTTMMGEQVLPSVCGVWGYHIYDTLFQRFQLFRTNACHILRMRLKGYCCTDRKPLQGDIGVS